MQLARVKKQVRGEKKQTFLLKVGDLRGLISNGLWTQPHSEFKVNLENTARQNGEKQIKEKSECFI